MSVDFHCALLRDPEPPEIAIPMLPDELSQDWTKDIDIVILNSCHLLSLCHSHHDYAPFDEDDDPRCTVDYDPNNPPDWDPVYGAHRWERSKLI